MSRFEEIMETVFRWEGGYVDHPDDPGGATNMGITHKVLAKWRGVSAVSKQEVKQLTKDEARLIFKEKYFKPIRGENLPWPIDLIMMDGAVNHGVPTMVRMFEKAVGLEENGRMSAANINEMTANFSEPEAINELAIALADARKERYTTRPHAHKFIRGWTNRLNDVMATALEDAPVKWNFATGKTDGDGAQPSEPDPISALIRPIIEDDELQAAMSAWGDYSGTIDGIFGPNSMAAANSALNRNNNIISGNWRAWSAKRKKIAIGQLICRDMDISVGRIDGLFGPSTEAAFIAFNKKLLNMPEDTWREDLDKIEIPTWKAVKPKTSPWPKESNLLSEFGTPKTSAIKLKRLNLPFAMKIAWDKGTIINGFSINERVHDSAARAFDKIYKEYGDDGIEDLGIDLFGGCYNPRRIRGGTRWSTHAWGIAIDFDPTRNGLRTNHLHARLARADAVKFWEIWEAEGWLSLGRARNYDWMHVQAAIR